MIWPPHSMLAPAVPTTPGVPPSTSCPPRGAVARLAGEPPYRILRQKTYLSKSTISRYLNGEASPRWGVVELLLEAWGVEPVDVDSVKAEWIELRELADPVNVDSLDTPAPHVAEHQLRLVHPSDPPEDLSA